MNEIIADNEYVRSKIADTPERIAIRYQLDLKQLLIDNPDLIPNKVIPLDTIIKIASGKAQEKHRKSTGKAQEKKSKKKTDDTEKKSIFKRKVSKCK